VSRKAKSWQGVLAGALWVVAAPWLAPVAHAQEQGPQSIGDQERLVAYVTFKVETAEGQWMRFAVRDHRAAVLQILSTGERFSLTPILGSEPDDLQIEVIRLGGNSEQAARTVERLNAKVGFPSYLSDASLQRIDVERIDMKADPTPAGLPQAPIISLKKHFVDFEVSEKCCITCGGITGCGCFVGASCGSCCSCCTPKP